MKYLMRFNLALGLWLMASPFVLVVINPGVLRLLWEDFILGFGIATFALCRLSSRRVAALADGLVGALGLITLINPILYHYFNVKVAAWNNLMVGSVVFILAIYQIGKTPNRQKWYEGPSLKALGAQPFIFEDLANEYRHSWKYCLTSSPRAYLLSHRLRSNLAQLYVA